MQHLKETHKMKKPEMISQTRWPFFSWRLEEWAGVQRGRRHWKAEEGTQRPLGMWWLGTPDEGQFIWQKDKSGKPQAGEGCRAASFLKVLIGICSSEKVKSLRRFKWESGKTISASFISAVPQILCKIFQLRYLWSLQRILVFTRLEFVL